MCRTWADAGGQLPTEPPIREPVAICDRGKPLSDASWLLTSTRYVTSSRERIVNTNGSDTGTAVASELGSVPKNTRSPI